MIKKINPKLIEIARKIGNSKKVSNPKVKKREVN